MKAFLLAVAATHAAYQITPAAKREIDDICARYDRSSTIAVLTSFDLIALECLEGGAAPSVLNSERALAGILIAISRNETADPLPLFEDWLRQNSQIDEEAILIALRALRGWYVARQQGKKVMFLHEAIQRPPDRTLASQVLEGLKAVDTDPLVKATVIRETTLNLKADRRGRLYVEALIRGERTNVMFDTGASGNFAGEALARRHNFRFLESPPIRGWTDGGPKEFASALSPPIEAGGLRLENLVFNVAPSDNDSDDNQLVLGAPALKALGRLAWLDGGKRLAIGAAAPTPNCVGSVRRAHELQLVLTIEGDAHSGPAPLIFDSGFVVPYLNERAARFYSPETKFSSDIDFSFRLPDHRGGGFSTRGVKKFSVSIGDAGIILRDVRAYAPMETGQLGYVAWLGTDVLKQIETLVIDFETMTFAAAPKGEALRTCAD
jgi:predicted aspartyl protease